MCLEKGLNPFWIFTDYPHFCLPKAQNFLLNALLIGNAYSSRNLQCKISTNNQNGSIMYLKQFLSKKKIYTTLFTQRETSIFNADVYGFQVRNPLILLDVLKVIL